MQKYFSKLRFLTKIFTVYTFKKNLTFCLFQQYFLFIEYYNTQIKSNLRYQYFE